MNPISAYPEKRFLGSPGLVRKKDFAPLNHLPRHHGKGLSDDNNDQLDTLVDTRLEASVSYLYLEIRKGLLTNPEKISTKPHLWPI
ncbi:hypothetical protein CEXT_187091 [Caerostris extrusa]|uniref:Uncharacterized protein n=1 Tax=Caerostris extrusa TaxID=172846 RepID=A0AAV4X9H1_CAEEX|nr:hypothetical protein CEXT_187091 [Caerostris extrusa]